MAEKWVEDWTDALRKTVRDHPDKCGCHLCCQLKMQEEMDAQTTELAALRADAECLRSIIKHEIDIVHKRPGVLVSADVVGYNEAGYMERDEEAEAATLPAAVAALVAKLEAGDPAAPKEDAG